MRADQPVRNVTIVGGGTAGWMTAAVLSKWLSKVEIRLIESDEIGIIGVGEATIPHIRNFLALAGIDPLKMISESKATFKLGIEFVDWLRPGQSYIHSFGQVGRGVGLIPFRQLWLRARALGQAGDYGDYSANIAAMLVRSELRGVETHGLRWLPSYCGSLQARRINPAPEIRVTSDLGAALLVDGDGGLGHVVSSRAMDLCLERRQELNAFIERTLSARSLPRACPSCGATLKANHRFKICDACHNIRKEERVNGTNPGGRPPHRFHQARRGPPPPKRGGKAGPARKPAPSA